MYAAGCGATVIDVPKVSICIPVRNCERYLRFAIESAVTQTYRDFEILIVDNQSSDASLEIAQSCAARHGNIRVHRNDRDLGLVGNFNKSLHLARGEYVKFLCADDVLLPACLERMVRALDEHPSVSLVTASRLMLDESGRTFATKRYARNEIVVAGAEAINRCLFRSNYMGEPTAVLFRRSCAVRGFREDLPQVTDIDMWYHLLERGDLMNLPEPLCGIRRHGGQMTDSNIRSGALIDDNVALFKQYMTKPYISATPCRRAQFKFRMAYRVWMSRKYLSSAKRMEVLRHHSSLTVYYLLIPPAAGVVYIRQLVGRLRARFRARTARTP